MGDRYDELGTAVIMAKTYISDISDYLNDIGLLKPDMPAPINPMAEFLLAIVEAVTPKCPTIGHNTGVRCRKRGCKGSDPRLASACRRQDYLVVPALRAKWRYQRLARHEMGPNDGPAAPPIVTYTPKEGQYLAFIYYYTKLNRQAPAERDMQVYFQVTPPAVHDMV